MARILLVDDEEPIRAFLKRGLEVDGHEVTVAVDGADGLDRTAALLLAPYLAWVAYATILNGAIWRLNG